ncbi:MAG: TIR domain-containing protein [Pseudomonadota bacterium]
MSSEDVFVSYSWKVERAFPFVQLLEDVLRDIPMKTNIKRDNRSIKTGERISAFMDELSESEHVIAVISDSYFHSYCCMYELVNFWEKSKFKNESLHVVYVDESKIPGLQSSDPEINKEKAWRDSTKSIERYKNHWKQELESLDESDDYYDDKKKNIEKYIKNLKKIIKDLKDRISNTAEEAKENNFTREVAYFSAHSRSTDIDNPFDSLDHDQRVQCIAQIDKHEPFQIAIARMDYGKKVVPMLCRGLEEDWHEGLTKKIQCHKLADSSHEPQINVEWPLEKKQRDVTFMEKRLWINTTKMLMREKWGNESGSSTTEDLQKASLQKAHEILAISGNVLVIRINLKFHNNPELQAKLIERYCLHWHNGVKSGNHVVIAFFLEQGHKKSSAIQSLFSKFGLGKSQSKFEELDELCSAENFLQVDDDNDDVDGIEMERHRYKPLVASHVNINDDIGKSWHTSIQTLIGLSHEQSMSMAKFLKSKCPDDGIRHKDLLEAVTSL